MERLIECRRVSPGAAAFVEHAGRELAVYHLAGDPAGRPAGVGRFVVSDNACPHAHGNLSGGQLAGSIITCPWHEWQFDLESGQCVHSPSARVRTYPCEVRDGWVCAEL